MAVKSIPYSESIFCEKCSGQVRMLNCRLLEAKGKDRAHVEFDYLCVDCGNRASASREREFLQYSERQFCTGKGLS